MTTVVSAATIRPLAGDDAAQVAAFLAEVYPAWQGDIHSARKYYAWKYCDKRGRDTGRPTGYMAATSNKPVGFLGCLPFTFQIAGKALPAAWICDWHVSENLRRLGVGRLLLERAMSDIPVMACVGGTADAESLFHRLGFQSFMSDSEWRRILRPFSFEWPRRRGWRRIAGLPRAAAHWCAGSHTAASSVSDLRLGSPVEPCELRSLLVSDKCGPVRDPGYLEWLLRCPHVAAEVRPFCVRQDRVGWTMLSTGTDSLGRKNSRVIELKVKDTLLRNQAWILCSRALESSRPAYITAMASLSESSALYSAGFQQRGDVRVWVRVAERHTTLSGEEFHVTLLDKDNAFRGQTLIP
jgi:hypothetical protein